MERLGSWEMERREAESERKGGRQKVEDGQAEGREA